MGTGVDQKAVGGLTRENLFLVGAGFTCAVFPGQAPANRDLMKAIVGQTPDNSALGKVWTRYGEDDIEIALTRMDIDIIRGAVTQKDRDDVSIQMAAFFQKFRFQATLNHSWLQPLLTILKPRDGIVTLNYDCFLEGFLDYHGMWSPKGGYGPRLINMLTNNFPDNTNEIIISKIHGSENFSRDSVIGGNESIGVAVEPSIFPKSSAYSHFGTVKSAMKGPALIAPSYVKKWPVEFADLLLDAFQTASEAKRMIIVGCSLRTEDPHLWLLHRAFFKGPNWKQKRVIIIDHNANGIADRLRRFWPGQVFDKKNLIPLQGSIQTGLQTLSTL